MEKRKINISFLCLIILVLFSCGPRSVDNKESHNSDNSSSHNQESKENSILDKFWIKYHFTDSEVNSHSEMIEQSMVDYLNEFGNHSDDDIVKSLHQLIKKSESSELFFKYLNSQIHFPNSEAIVVDIFSTLPYFL